MTDSPVKCVFTWTGLFVHVILQQFVHTGVWDHYLSESWLRVIVMFFLSLDVYACLCLYMLASVLFHALSGSVHQGMLLKSFSSLASYRSPIVTNKTTLLIVVGIIMTIIQSTCSSSVIVMGLVCLICANILLGEHALAKLTFSVSAHYQKHINERNTI